MYENPYFRALKRFRSKIVPLEMETSAIGDIAFLLLIFFIVTSSFMMKQGIFLSLPSLSEAPARISESGIFEIMPLEKDYMVDGSVLSGVSVLEKLTERHRENQDLVYLIRMAPYIKYKRLIDALSIARRAGVEKISIKDHSNETE